MVRLFGRQSRCVDTEWVVNARVGHEVRLELDEVGVEATVEAQTSCDGGYHLAEQPVQVGVSRTLDIKTSSEGKKVPMNMLLHT